MVFCDIILGVSLFPEFYRKGVYVMGKVNERTLRMRNEFMCLHSQGATIAEIAKEFGLSVSVVYKDLDFIANANGVTRESLLQRVHKEHAPFERTPGKPLPEVDPESFNAHCDAAIAEVDGLRKEIRVIIAKNEEFLNEEDE